MTNLLKKMSRLTDNDPRSRRIPQLEPHQGRDILEKKSLPGNAHQAEEVRENLQQLQERAAKSMMRQVDVDCGLHYSECPGLPGIPMSSPKARRKQHHGKQEDVSGIFLGATQISPALPVPDLLVPDVPVPTVDAPPPVIPTPPVPDVSNLPVPDVSDLPPEVPTPPIQVSVPLVPVPAADAPPCEAPVPAADVPPCEAPALPTEAPAPPVPALLTEIPTLPVPEAPALPVVPVPPAPVPPVPVPPAPSPWLLIQLPHHWLPSSLSLSPKRSRTVRPPLLSPGEGGA
nr:vegetative cell wall protein gp1-like [Paramormyrops kingsleyae]